MKTETPIASVEVLNGKLHYKSWWRRILYWINGKVHRKKITRVEFQDPSHPGEFIEIGRMVEEENE